LRELCSPAVVRGVVGVVGRPVSSAGDSLPVAAPLSLDVIALPLAVTLSFSAGLIYTCRPHRVRSWWCNVGCSVSASCAGSSTIASAGTAAGWCVERAVDGGVAAGADPVLGGLGTGCRFGLGVCRLDKLGSTAGALDTAVTRHWLEYRYLPKQQRIRVLTEGS
jgi:hypothetical protein